MKLLTFASRLNCFHGVFGQIKTVTPCGEIFLNFISGRKNVSKSGCKTEPWNCRVTPQFHGSVLQTDLLTFLLTFLRPEMNFKNSFDLTQNSVKAVLTVSNLIMMRTYVFR